ncbi:hypothetical protein [Roseibium aggregatum]|uniref:YcxB-like protein domain-containing protein n=1 Tax=Roseibium aggregatum TaxID=187304 RepID=A0A939EDT2_9HYPH|nr:hypothetical protein [Roseibium aggregatum]MBN9669759.1 hypothetical protein [Roseibium aggregatum]
MNYTANFELLPSDLKAYKYLCETYSRYLVGRTDPAEIKRESLRHNVIVFVLWAGLGLLCSYMVHLLENWVTFEGSFTKLALLISFVALLFLGAGVSTLKSKLCVSRTWKYMFEPFEATAASAKFDDQGCSFESEYSRGRVNWRDSQVAVGQWQDTLWIVSPAHNFFVPQRALKTPISIIIQEIEAKRPAIFPA